MAIWSSYLKAGRLWTNNPKVDTIVVVVGSFSSFTAIFSIIKSTLIFCNELIVSPNSLLEVSVVGGGPKALADGKLPPGSEPGHLLACQQEQIPPGHLLRGYLGCGPKISDSVSDRAIYMNR